jgi:hypothetical protein
MSNDCIVIQTLHGQSCVAYCGTETECIEWVKSLPAALRFQFRVYTVL